MGKGLEDSEKEVGGVRRGGITGMEGEGGGRGGGKE